MNKPEPMNQRDFAQFEWGRYMSLHGPEATYRTMERCCPRLPVPCLKVRTTLSQEHRALLVAQGCTITEETTLDAVGRPLSALHLTFPEGSWYHEVYPRPSDGVRDQFELPTGLRFHSFTGASGLATLSFPPEQPPQRERVSAV